jgi:hypothetical protein
MMCRKTRLVTESPMKTSPFSVFRGLPAIIEEVGRYLITKIVTFLTGMTTLLTMSRHNVSYMLDLIEHIQSSS